MFDVEIDKKNGLASATTTLPPASRAGKQRVTIGDAKSHLLSKGLKVDRLLSGRNVSNMDCQSEVKATFVFSLLDFKPAPVIESKDVELSKEEVRRPRRRQTQKKED